MKHEEISLNFTTVAPVFCQICTLLAYLAKLSISLERLDSFCLPFSQNDANTKFRGTVYDLIFPLAIDHWIIAELKSHNTHFLFYLGISVTENNVHLYLCLIFRQLKHTSSSSFNGLYILFYCIRL